jgi:hypothetical protein
MAKYKLASDFLTGVITEQKTKLEHKDLFYVLTNYRKKDKYPEELLLNTNLFYLYIIHKIPFDLNILKLLPESYNDTVQKIITWNTYLHCGKINADIPHIFQNGKSLLIPRDIKQGYDCDADTIDVIHYMANKSKYRDVLFYSGGMPLPGMLSYEVSRLSIVPQVKEVEFVEFLVYYPEPHVWVSSTTNTLEEVKLLRAEARPDILIYEASPYITTKQEYQLAYVLCRKKLIIIKDTKRQNQIKQWLNVSLPSPSPPSPPSLSVSSVQTVWTSII